MFLMLNYRDKILYLFTYMGNPKYIEHSMGHDYMKLITKIVPKLPFFISGQGLTGCL